ncbi:hypothetical protein K505DRAFT_325666 [Melanomma pulvis-pyrius CBS 109.77]|uniref:Uncharacterized protein n=1 Tax=Melanomma pulvis-pyrius CBS 109.77 TaxID=1314802 RepID=A0A6A6XA63_9PLEO|nr:hypothetical protein K505DRAFT_325666 [Melanomma pulvis-pyrius CBS 109.77]
MMRRRRVKSHPTPQRTVPLRSTALCGLCLALASAHHHLLPRLSPIPNLSACPPCNQPSSQPYQRQPTPIAK